MQKQWVKYSLFNALNVLELFVFREKGKLFALLKHRFDLLRMHKILDELHKSYKVGIKNVKVHQSSVHGIQITLKPRIQNLTSLINKTAKYKIMGINLCSTKWFSDE